MGLFRFSFVSEYGILSENEPVHGTKSLFFCFFFLPVELASSDKASMWTNENRLVAHLVGQKLAEVIAPGMNENTFCE